MAFFTRKGLTVPEFPSDTVLTEETEEFSLPPIPSTSAASAARCESIASKSAPKYVAPSTPINNTASQLTTSCSSSSSGASIILSNAGHQTIEDSEVVAAGAAASNTIVNKADDETDQSRFDYIVDRTYGVEV